MELGGCTLAVGTRVVIALDVVAVGLPGVTTAHFLAATTPMDGHNTPRAAVAVVAAPGLEARCGCKRSKDSQGLDEQHFEKQLVIVDV